MFKSVLVTAVSVLALGSQAAFAGADCPAAPKDQWMSELDMQKKIINEYGFSIRKFKVDDNCYEIYGMTAAGDSTPAQRVEVYFNPVNGEIVKQEIED